MIVDSDLYFKCALKAAKLLQLGYIAGEIPHEDLTRLLIKLETEKAEKEAVSDQSINYNDEVVSIEPVGELETMDISVSGDNLFYCNGILTKNSFGLPATADFMFALISTEDLEKLGQLMVKQLKNRWGSIDSPKRFIIGVDRAKMKLFDVEESAQDGVTGGTKQVTQEDRPLFDSSEMMQDTDFEQKKLGSFKKKKPNFGGFN